MPEKTPLIVLVDDEEQITKTWTTYLENKGYSVAAFTSPLECKDYLFANRGEVDFLITDFSMPGMDGIELVRSLADEGVHFPIILCSGFQDLFDCEEAINYGVTRVIWKPFPMAELENAIEELLTYY